MRWLVTLAPIFGIVPALAPALFAQEPVNPPSYAEKLGIRIVTIRGGEFPMGTSKAQMDAMQAVFPKLPIAIFKLFETEQPQHTVRITKLLGCSAHEITKGQFGKFVEDTGYVTEAEKDGVGYGWDEEKKIFAQDPQYTWKNPGFGQTPDHPVVNVSWNDAAAFTEWLSRKDGRQFRLPTEAEWEYCCRAGERTLYAHGNNPEGLSRYGNIYDVSGAAKFGDKARAITADDGYAFTAPVGRYQPNAFGLYDMHGNVWEWCLDMYDPEFYARSPAKDPVLSAGDASVRALRGGSWFNRAEFARSALRDRRPPSNRLHNLGFRAAVVSSDR